MSKFFFWICAFLFLVGFMSFVYQSFKVDVSRQDQLLYEIREAQRISFENQTKIVELEKSNKDLKETNDKLVQTVCLLQKQLESLGAEPVVIDEKGCTAGV